jgi:hypothetical protein
VAVTVVLQGAAVDRCTVRVSPLAELCACLHAFNEHSHHPDSRAWAGAVRAEITPALLAECQTWAPLWGSRRAQFMFPSDASGECGLDEEMSAIERLPTAVFVAMSALPIVDSDWSIAFHRLLEDRADRRNLHRTRPPALPRAPRAGRAAARRPGGVPPAAAHVPAPVPAAGLRTGVAPGAAHAARGG